MTTQPMKRSGTHVNLLLALLLLAGTAAAATGHALAAGPTVGWNTFLGGNADDEARAIARDDAGNLYIAGHSGSTWGNPILPFSAMKDCFVAKLNPSGPADTSDAGLGRTDPLAVNITVFPAFNSMPVSNNEAVQLPPGWIVKFVQLFGGPGNIGKRHAKLH